MNDAEKRIAKAAGIMGIVFVFFFSLTFAIGICFPPFAECMLYLSIAIMITFGVIFCLMRF